MRQPTLYLNPRQSMDILFQEVLEMVDEDMKMKFVAPVLP